MAKTPKHRIDFDPDENPGFEPVHDPSKPPSYQIVKTSSPAFNDLQDTIFKNPKVLTAPGVIDGMDALKKLDKSLKEAEKVFSSLNDAINIFTSGDTNVCDMISGGFDVLSSIVRVTGVLTGTIAITSVIARALDLVGSIFGYFGAPSNDTSYYKILTQMMDDANNASLSKEIQTEIAGIIALIYSRHVTVTNLVEDVKKDKSLAKDLGTTHSDITNSYFSEIGVIELGMAVKNISDNTLKDNHNNWGETAETFYMSNKLIAMKILFYLDGVNYFNLAETDEQKKLKTSRLNTALNDSNAFRDKYYKFCKEYFGTPSLTNAAITHNIYRLEFGKFELIARLNNFLDINREIAFWPVGEKSKTWFTCSLTHTAPGANNVCTRLSTMNARNLGSKKDNEHRILTTRKNDDPTFEWEYNNDDIKPPFFEKNIKSEVGDDGTRTHFELTEIGQTHFDYAPENKDIKLKTIPYAWQFIAKNTQQKRWTNTITKYVLKEKKQLFKQDDLYIFKVYPTTKEIENKGNAYWPDPWQNDAKPVAGKTYVMIGSRGGDHEMVWCDWDGKGEYRMESYYDIVYTSHWGNPDHCMWEFLIGVDGDPK